MNASNEAAAISIEDTLRLALEALKTLVERFDYEQFTSVCELDDAKDAITTLKEALAKQEPVAEPHKGEPVAYIRKDQLQKAAKSTFFCEVTPEPRQDRIGIYTTPQQRTWVGLDPEGEPVALETVYETIIHWDEGGGKRSRRELAKRIVALYTTPQPKREPLTDDQIYELCRKYLRVSQLDGYSIHGGQEFARAIEAAHGIKE